MGCSFFSGDVTFCCLCASAFLHVCICLVILRLMTRAVPDSPSCHRIVTNSLGRLTTAKNPAPANPPAPIMLQQTHIQTPPPPQQKRNTLTNINHYVSCCLDSLSCVYIAIDGCLKTSLWIDVFAGQRMCMMIQKMGVDVFHVRVHVCVLCGCVLHLCE